jgi:DNA-binding MarR family transcriptional regulator
VSWQALEWALSIHGQCIGRDARHVLVQLANHHNAKTGRCDPSQLGLAESTGMDKRTVQRRLADLVERGLVGRVVGGGRGRRSQYVLQLDKGCHCAAVDDAERVAHRPERVAHRRLKGGTLTPEPVINLEGTSSAVAPSEPQTRDHPTRDGYVAAVAGYYAARGYSRSVVDTMTHEAIDDWDAVQAKIA